MGLGAAAIGRSTMASNAYSTATENEQVAYDDANAAAGTAGEADAQVKLDEAQAELATAATDLTRSVFEFNVLLIAALIVGGLSIAAVVLALVLALILRERASAGRGSVYP